MEMGIPIVNICQQSPMAALVVCHDTPLREVIDKLSHQHHATPIFVTDGTERLHGVVRYDDLRDWVRLQCNLMPSNNSLSAGRTRRRLSAQTIGELAQHDGSLMSIQQDESLSEAMTKMSAYDRDHMAVVDGNGRFINTLNLQDILSFIMEKERKTQL